MDFFRNIRETFRDHARDDICAGLQRLGIDAQMAPRRGPEERVGGSGFLGVIDITEGPIRWVNVRKVTHSGGPEGGGGTDYYTEYGVPDSRLGPNSPKPQIKTVRMKTFPLFGKVVDLHWKGKDFGLEIISRLNSDTSLKDPIMRSRDVTIRAHGDHSCWIISTETRDIPSGDAWNCYQAIAQHLLR